MSRVLSFPVAAVSLAGTDYPSDEDAPAAGMRARDRQRDVDGEVKRGGREGRRAVKTSKDARGRAAVKRFE